MEEFKVPDVPLSGFKGEKKSGDTLQQKSCVNSNKKDSSAPYDAPWSILPTGSYKFEVLKSGQIIDEVLNLEQKASWSFGRLPDNDIEMAHPTISRHHAVLQYKPKIDNNELNEESEAVKSDQPEGWYIYDLSSTHGTFLNKQRIPPRVFIRVRVGHMIKLGASTRNYILHGPVEDEEPESELTVTELRAQREKQVAEAAAEAERRALEAEERERNEGASWGMAEDADEETDLTHNPYASTNNEELFLDDPKRTLRGYFEREGLQLEYKCDEMSAGSFVCRVELPLDDSNGRPIVAEVMHKGRKKDCVVQCALEACRILDRHGVLRQANQEPLKRKHKEKDSDSDDDDFWDRTGDIERKKQRKANVGVNVTLTYDDLIKQEDDLKAQLNQIESDIAAYHENQKRLKSVKEQQDSAIDDLDNFMETLTDDITQVDKTEIKKLRFEQQRIKTEQQKVQRLIKLTKPTELPFASTQTGKDAKSNQDKSNLRQLPMIGKRNQFSKMKVLKSASKAENKPETKTLASDEEEFDEEEPKETVETVHKIKTDTEDSKSNKKAKIESANIESKSTSMYSEPKGVVQELESSKINNKESSPVPAESQLETKSLDAVEGDSTATTSDVHMEDDSVNPKRRQRARQRNKQREDVDKDELEEHEVSDKYAKWVPPPNQTGDGMTLLNEKFGY